jgi:hypothetical protein
LLLANCAAIEAGAGWPQPLESGESRDVLSSPTVAIPVAVRYGWANTPDMNLFNKEADTPGRTKKACWKKRQ